jgi:hypothetical protein
VTFVASTGDDGSADPEYPAYSPNVVAVGGTSLYLSADGSYASETEWGDASDTLGKSIGSGGGTSLYQPEPAYQQGVQSTGSRTTPDVSFVGDPATGVWIADAYNHPGTNPFATVGGTSLSAPAWAGLLAIGNEGRAEAGAPALNSASPTETQQALYSLPHSDYHIVSSGFNGASASTGYNLMTGLGTPVANLLVPGLIANKGPAAKHIGPTVAALHDATHAGGDTPSVFSAFTATGSGLSGVPSPAARLATSLVNLAPPVAATTTAAAAPGSPLAMSIGSSSVHGPGQSLGSISNSSSAGVTSAPLVGVTSSSFSIGLAPQLPVWSPPRPALISPSVREHEAVFSAMDRRNLDRDAFALERTQRELAAESVLADVAASLLPSRRHDAAPRASLPALPPAGVTVGADALDPGLQQDQDVPSATSAAGVVFGLAAGLWAARAAGIRDARKRTSRSPFSRLKSLDFRPGKKAR